MLFCIDVADVKISMLDICLALGIGCKKCGDVWRVYSDSLELLKKFMLDYWGEYDFTKIYTEYDIK